MTGIHPLCFPAVNARQFKSAIGQFEGAARFHQPVDEGYIELKILLSRWGCDARTANAINQSFVEISEQKPDLLLVDFQPGEVMTGVELIQATRGEWLGEDIPAVLVTADKQPELPQSALKGTLLVWGNP